MKSDNGLPLTIVNIAVSVDGKIAPYNHEKVSLSNKEDFYFRDIMRSKVDGVMVGGATLRNDDPSLLIKDPYLIQQRESSGRTAQPAGIALMNQLHHLTNLKFSSCTQARRIIMTKNKDELDKYPELKNQMEFIISDTKDKNLVWMFRQLYLQGIKTLMVEGGGNLLYSLISAELVDEIYVSINPYIIGGSSSPSAVDGEGFQVSSIKKIRLIHCWKMGTDSIKLHYQLRSGKVRSRGSEDGFEIIELV